MGFTVQRSPGTSDRLTITTDMGAKAENVKEYTGFTATLACWFNFAEEIKDKAGNVYVVNNRSVGKAWATQVGFIGEKTDNVKDVAAKQFFQKGPEDRFIWQLREILQNEECAAVYNEIGRLIAVMCPEPGTAYRREGLEEETRIYNRVKQLFLKNIIQKNYFPEWKSNWQDFFPDAKILSDPTKREKMIVFLKRIQAEKSEADRSSQEWDSKVLREGIKA